MTVILLQKIPIMLLHFMGKTWKKEGFEKKPQSDYLRKNNIEVNVWFSCNQSNQCSAIHFFIRNTCDKMQ